MSDKTETEMVTIPKSVYHDLQRRDNMLTYLENYGVDNWGGYGMAMTEFNENEGNTEED